MQVRTFTVIAAMTLALTSACGDGVETTESSGNKADTAEKSKAKAESKEIKTYFDSLATEDPDEIQSALDVSAPDSIAFAYAKHQQNLGNAALDAGQPSEGSTSKEIDGGFESCTEISPDEEDYCVQYTDIETEVGKIANFTVSDRDISKAIALGNGEKKDLGKLGEVEYLSSYEAASGTLFVAYQVTSKKTGLNVLASSATYRGSDGRQRTADNAMSAGELSADSTATMYSTFPKGKLGGEMSLETFSEDGYKEGRATIKTR